MIDTQKLLSSSIDSENKIKYNNNLKNKKNNKSKNAHEIEKNNCNNFIKKTSERKGYSKGKINEVLDKSKNEKDNSKIKYNKYNDSKYFIAGQIEEEINEGGKKYHDHPKNENKNNFLSFVCFKISCKKQINGFQILGNEKNRLRPPGRARTFRLRAARYEDFRKKIISEEHLIRNHLNIYNLLKISKRKLNSRRNSYRLKDLINLV